MRTRTHRLTLLPLALVLSLAATCPPAHPDPEARAAQIAQEVVMRLGELQSAAIAANAEGLLSDPDAVRVVRFTTASVRTVQQTPYGWGPSVTQAYSEIAPWLRQQPRLAPIVALIDILFGRLL